MKIIDAHMHFCDYHGFSRIALEAGHVNSAEHLAKVYAECGIEFGIAMGTSGGGNAGPDVLAPGVVNLAGEYTPECDCEQPSYLAFCAGVSGGAAASGKGRAGKSLAAFDELLSCARCVGLKLYPGYDSFYPGDKAYFPYYELARKHDVPVVFHSGDTASSRARVKYAHPLAVDDAAAAFPDVRFVIAHYGCPWIPDATEVAMKNPNVFIDLSGLAEGNFEPDAFIRRKHGFLELMRTWMDYLDDYGKFMFGTDWPLVNIPAYIDVIKSVIPEEAREAVFYKNAMKVFTRLRLLERKNSEHADS